MTPVARKPTTVGIPSLWKMIMMGTDMPINTIISLSNGMPSIAER